MIIQHEGTKDTKNTKAHSLKLSYEIIGAAIEVHRAFGPGLLESVYELALCRELWLRGVRVDRQVPVAVRYKGGVLDCELRVDMVVDRDVTVEVKSVEKLAPIHTAQMLTYLRMQNLWLELLLNFNVDVLRDGIRRVLNG